VQVTSSDGLALEVQVDGPGDAVSLVCLHGVTASAEEFAWLADRLSGQYRVVRPSFRGHGASGRPDGPYLGPDYVADAIAVLEQAVDGPALLLGHSLGGVVALAVAQQRPDLVHALLVIDPGLLVAEEVADGEPLDTMGLGEVFRLIHGAMPHVQASGISAEAFAEQLLQTPTLQGSTAAELYVDGTTSWWARSQLQLDTAVLDVVVDPTTTRERVPFDVDRPVLVPTLALLADPAVPDAIVGPERQAQLEAAGSPDLEVVVVEGAGHNLQDERAHRDTFLAHLDRWLAAHG
jgi:pimeloyl-ACP methyl ester carboxylesterase